MRAEKCTVLLGLWLVGCAPKPVVLQPDASLPRTELEESSPVKPFVGTYKFVGGDEERARVEAEIDSVCEGFNVLIRGLAKDRLMKAVVVPTSLVLTAEADVFTIREDEHPYAAKLDGTPIRVEMRSGDTMDLHYVFGEKLEQLFVNDAGTRTHTYELKDGKLSMHVHITSPKLPREIQYDLTFERA
ncbi:MAG: hypothetical protein U0271_06785 [Polyangiaceae bacterium]